ncbi:MAG: DUF5127 domain-containing protein, partial [Planctomycetota bacterium]
GGGGGVIGAEQPEVPAPQESATIPGFTTTRFVSLVEGVQLDLAFVTPALPEELETFARPVTYVELRAWSHDEREHAIDLYVDIASLAAVENPGERVRGRLLAIDGLETAAVEALDAPMATASGSTERLERGQVLVSARKGPGVRANFGPAGELRRAFVEKRSANVTPEFLEPRAAADGASALSVRLEGRGGAGYVTATSRELPVVARAMLAYDEPWSVRWCEEWLPPYWRRDALDAATMLQAADAVGAQLVERCAEFDRELAAELGASFGPEDVLRCQQEYLRGRGQSALCVDAMGRPLLFARGAAAKPDISGIDALVALAPQQLLFSSDLAKALLIPVLERSAARDWTSSLPPHDLGTFPHAQSSTPESEILSESTASDGANLILLVAALCQREGRVEFAARYWKQISSWSRLLAEELTAPGNAPLAASARAKSILALGAVSQLVQRMGSAQRSQELAELARAQAKELGHTQLAASDVRDMRAWAGALKLELFSSRAGADALAAASDSAVRSDADSVFLRVLGDADLWSRWFARGARGPLNWAPAPIGMGEILVPDARSGAHEWSWTIHAPAEGWQGPEFDETGWTRGPGAFAAPAATLNSARTPWIERTLWLRRSFELASVPQDEVRLSLQLLGEVEVWINGVLAARVASGAGGTLLWKLTDDARAALAQGRNILAVRCARERDDAIFDAGLVLLPRARR